MSKTLGQCALCGGAKAVGRTTFTAELGSGVLVVRNVPALVCGLCGEEWLEDETALRLEALADTARRSRPIVEVVDWEEKVAA